MLKKTIVFKDLDGKELMEDFYFNITKAEMTKLEMSKAGGLSNHLRMIVAANDGATIISAMTWILEQSYGVRSEDGRRFIKTPELWAEFVQTGAYDELFMELVTNADTASQFIKSVFPVDVVAKMAEVAAEDDAAVEELRAALNGPIEPGVIRKKTFDDYTQDELLEMDDKAFELLVGIEPQKMTKAQLTMAMRRMTWRNNSAK